MLKFIAVLIMVISIVVAAIFEYEGILAHPAYFYLWGFAAGSISTLLINGLKRR